MQKAVLFFVFLLIGTIMGISIGIYYFARNQPPSVSEQVKVTIQGIEFKVSDHSVLEIELLNDAPEKNLNGILGIYQGDKQWTSEVTWYYTGQGEAAILCDTINENQSFRIIYNEKNPKATYLDRTIEWYEVETEEMTFTFMETEELRITSVTFTNSTALTVNLQNTGTTDVTITGVTVTGGNVTAATLTSDTVLKGTSDSFVLTITGGKLVAGTAYNVELLSTKGNKFSYTETY